MTKHIYMQKAGMLGSVIELRLVGENESAVERHFSELWGRITDFNDRFSRFRSESELSMFNRQAGEKIPISNEFERMLRKAQYFSELTVGVFNPFILPGLQRAGYVHSMSSETTDAPDHSHRKVTDHENLEIGEGWARVPPDTALDLGGIGKGYLADELAAYLCEHIEDFNISLGGDIRVGGNSPDGPWIIDIQSVDDSARNTGVYISKKATFGIATSGAIRTKRGREQQHLIDPRSGAPAGTSHAMCTVVADDAVTADVLASCFLIEGEELGRDLFKAQHARAILLQGGRHAVPFILGEGFTLQNVSVESKHEPKRNDKPSYV